MTTFKKLCEEAAETAGVDLEFASEDVSRTDAFEDDGFLHVQKGRMRAVFDIGQDTPSRHANPRITAILNHIGMSKFVGKRTLFQEDEEDCGDCCPHCGR